MISCDIRTVELASDWVIANLGTVMQLIGALINDKLSAPVFSLLRVVLVSLGKGIIYFKGTAKNFNGGNHVRY